MNRVLFTSNSEMWATPQEFFDKLNDEFNFTLDPCSNDENHKCEKYFTEKENGLIQDWGGQRVFCNPPYGRKIASWVKKCHDEAQKGTLVVMLIPARTDTSYFHDYIYNKAELRFVRGRLKFGNAKQGAPFPSMIVVYNGNITNKIEEKEEDPFDKYLRMINPYGSLFSAEWKSRIEKERREMIKRGEISNIIEIINSWEKWAENPEEFLYNMCKKEIEEYKKNKQKQENKL